MGKAGEKSAVDPKCKVDLSGFSLLETSVALQENALIPVVSETKKQPSLMEDARDLLDMDDLMRSDEKRA